MGDSTRRSKRFANETPEQREKRLAYHRDWMRRFRANNPDKTRELNRRHRDRHKDRIRQERKKRYAENRETIIAKVCEYAKRNRSKINARRRQREADDPEAARLRRRANYLRNRESDKLRRAAKRTELAAYMRAKRNSDPAFLVADRLRRRINSALATQKARKAAGLINISGCSAKQLADHLESQFQPGMSWENRRMWHIDHIVPCSAFNLTDETQQMVAFHYTNLRPVWSSENQSKNNKIPGGQRQLFWTTEHVQKARRIVSMPKP